MIHTLIQHPTLKRPVPKRPVPLKVVALGDSLVYGFGDIEGGGWVERLRRQWMQADDTGPVLYNLGVRGDTVRHVSRRLEQEVRYRGELRHRIPDVILLSVGVNDSARLGQPQGRHFTPFAEFQTELAQLLDQAQALGPVLFIGMIPVNEAKMPFMDAFFYNHADQHLYQEATHLACQERHIPYLDTFGLWQQRGVVWCDQQLTPDGLHPNSQGYQALLADVLSWQPIQDLTDSPQLP